MKFKVNDTEYEITDVVHHKQSPEYYKALEERDAHKAHMLFIPPTQIPYYLIKARMDMIMLHENFKAEQKRIDEMSPEMLRIETELMLKQRCSTDERRKVRPLLIFLTIR